MSVKIPVDAHEYQGCINALRECKSYANTRAREERAKGNKLAADSFGVLAGKAGGIAHRLSEAELDAF